MSKVIDQKEYLKKYLSSDSKLEKKKKKKSKDKDKAVKKATVKIIDDDAYAHYGQEENDEGDIFATNEEAPQIIGIVDERAPDVIMKQEYIESGKWKSLVASEKEKINHKSIDTSTSKNKNKNNYNSPPRRKRQDSSDASPPRQRRRDSDASPPRQRRRDSDASPPRQRRRDSDASPPRQRKRRDSDESPPRKSSNVKKERRSRSPKSSRSDYKGSRWSSSNVRVKSESLSPPPTHGKKMTKTLDGKSAGLQNARELKRENDEFRSRQDKMFQKMGDDALGRNAEVVVRDRKGRNKELAFDAEKERFQQKLDEARKKEYDRWGKGLKQQEELEKRREEFAHEANKPLARFEDDEDLQKHLKDRELVDDPMLMYMRKKKQEEQRSRGVLEKPLYSGQFPDNRFQIRPGYRWDGVDRSNGYEKKYFMMISSKKSIEEEAYRYSTEDM